MKKNDFDVEALKGLGWAFLPTAIATLAFVVLLEVIQFLR
jgi:hypothetical protein